MCGKFAHSRFYQSKYLIMLIIIFILCAGVLFLYKIFCVKMPNKEDLLREQHEVRLELQSLVNSFVKSLCLFFCQNKLK